jgi:hypothetical protein
LASVAGVDGVAVQAGKATVTGSREAIARVGALLVVSGTIPVDLSVRIPDLEDALVELLEGDAMPQRLNDEPQTRAGDCELIGAMR